MLVMLEVYYRAVQLGDMKLTRTATAKVLKNVCNAQALNMNRHICISVNSANFHNHIRSGVIVVSS
jgi:hypothetical protein